MLRKFLWTIAAACLVACPGLARAGEVDILVQKLVDKGVLTPYEAQIVLDDTKQEVAKQNSKGTNEAIPSWVQTIKIKGDTRVRFEAVKDKQSTGDVASPSTHKYLTHERLRVRLGMEAKPNDLMKVGIGIATGKANDPRSRNVSLGNSTDATTTGTTSDGPDYTPGSAKNILLDYAYAQYTPNKFATIVAGKFQNPMWNPWDMIWKGDITPEGAAVQLNYPINSDLSIFVNNLGFILRTSDAAGGKNTGMYATQPGVVWNVTPAITMKSAVAYYQFENLRGNSRFSYSKGGNRTINPATGAASTTFGTAVYQNNYNSINPNMEIGFQNPFGGFGGAIPYASIFGDYIKNLSAHDVTSTSGFDAGVKVGYEKVADWKQWQLRGAISKMGKDAWVDAFTDSDRYQKGKTDTVSYEGICELGLGKNTSLVVDYYYSQMLLKGAAGSLPEQLVQVDWNLKF